MEKSGRGVLTLVLYFLLLIASRARSDWEPQPCTVVPIGIIQTKPAKFMDYEKYIDNANPIHVAVQNEVAYEIIYNIQIPSKRSVKVIFYMYVNDVLYYIETVFTDHEVLKVELEKYGHYFAKDFHAVIMCGYKLWPINSLIVISPGAPYERNDDVSVYRELRHLDDTNVKYDASGRINYDVCNVYPYEFNNKLDYKESNVLNPNNERVKVFDVNEHATCNMPNLFLPLISHNVYFTDRYKFNYMYPFIADKNYHLPSSYQHINIATEPLKTTNDFININNDRRDILNLNYNSVVDNNELYHNKYSNLYQVDPSESEYTDLLNRKGALYVRNDGSDRSVIPSELISSDDSPPFTNAEICTPKKPKQEESSLGYYMSVPEPYTASSVTGLKQTEQLSRYYTPRQRDLNYVYPQYDVLAESRINNKILVPFETCRDDISPIEPNFRSVNPKLVNVLHSLTPENQTLNDNLVEYFKSSEFKQNDVSCKYTSPSMSNFIDVSHLYFKPAESKLNEVLGKYFRTAQLNLDVDASQHLLHNNPNTNEEYLHNFRKENNFSPEHFISNDEEFYNDLSQEYVPSAKFSGATFVVEQANENNVNPKFLVPEETSVTETLPQQLEPTEQTLHRKLSYILKKINNKEVLPIYYLPEEKTPEKGSNEYSTLAGPNAEQAIPQYLTSESNLKDSSEEARIVKHSAQYFTPSEPQQLDQVPKHLTYTKTNELQVQSQYLTPSEIELEQNLFQYLPRTQDLKPEQCFTPAEIKLEQTLPQYLTLADHILEQTSAQRSKELKIGQNLPQDLRTADQNLEQNLKCLVPHNLASTEPRLDKNLPKYLTPAEIQLEQALSQYFNIEQNLEQNKLPKYWTPAELLLEQDLPQYLTVEEAMPKGLLTPAGFWRNLIPSEQVLERNLTTVESIPETFLKPAILTPERYLSSIELIPERYLTSAKPIADRYLTQTEPIPDKYLTQPEPIPDKYLTQAEPTPEKYLTQAVPIPEKYLTQAEPIPERYLTPAEPAPQKYLTQAEPIPKIYLTSTVPITERYLTPTESIPERYLTPTQPIPVKYLTQAELIPEKYLTQAELIPERYLTPAEPILEKYLTQAELIPERYLTAAETTPEKYLIQAEPIPERYLTTTEPIPENYLTQAEPIPDKYLTQAEPIPDRYLTPTEPTLEKYLTQAELIPERYLTPAEPIPEKYLTQTELIPERYLTPAELKPEQYLAPTEPIPEKYLTQAELIPEKYLTLAEPIPKEYLTQVELIPDRYLTPAETTPEKYLTQAEPIPDKYLTQAELIPEKYLTQAEPISEKYLTQPELIPERYLTTTEPIPDKYLIQAGPIPEKYFTQAEPLPEKYLTQAEPILERYLTLAELIPERYLTPAEPIPEKYLTQAELIPERYLTPAELKPEQYLTPAEPIPGKYLTQAELIPDKYLTLAEPIPEEYLTQAEPILERYLTPAELIPETYLTPAETTPEKYLTQTEPIPERYSTTADLIPESYLTLAEPISKSYLTSTVPILERYLTPAKPIADIYLSSTAPILQKYLKPAELIPYRYLTPAELIPERYLTHAEPILGKYLRTTELLPDKYLAPNKTKLLLDSTFQITEESSTPIRLTSSQYWTPAKRILKQYMGRTISITEQSDQYLTEEKPIPDQYLTASNPMTAEILTSTKLTPAQYLKNGQSNPELKLLQQFTPAKQVLEKFLSPTIPAPKQYLIKVTEPYPEQDIQQYLTPVKLNPKYYLNENPVVEQYFTSTKPITEVFSTRSKPIRVVGQYLTTFKPVTEEFATQANPIEEQYLTITNSKMEEFSTPAESIVQPYLVGTNNKEEFTKQTKSIAESSTPRKLIPQQILAHTELYPEQGILQYSILAKENSGQYSISPIPIIQKFLTPVKLEKHLKKVEPKYDLSLPYLSNDEYENSGKESFDFVPEMTKLNISDKFIPMDMTVNEDFPQVIAANPKDVADAKYLTVNDKQPLKNIFNSKILPWVDNEPQYVIKEVLPSPTHNLDANIISDDHMTKQQQITCDTNVYEHNKQNFSPYSQYIIKSQKTPIPVSYYPESSSSYSATESLRPCEIISLKNEEYKLFSNKVSDGSVPCTLIHKTTHNPYIYLYPSKENSILMTQSISTESSDSYPINSELEAYLKTSLLNSLHSNEIKSIIYNNLNDNRNVTLGVGIAKYDPTVDEKHFTVNTDRNDINLMAWYSKLKLLKVKIILEPSEQEVLNILPVVNDKSKYNTNEIAEIAKNSVTQLYGEHLGIKGVYSKQNPYAVVNTDNSINSRYILLWPTYCGCGCMKCGCNCYWKNH